MSGISSVQPIGYSIAIVLMPPHQEGSTEMQLTMELPKDAQETLATIFGDPIHTRVSLTPTGIQALLPAPPPNLKLAEVAVPRLHVQTPLANECAGAIAKLYNKFVKDNKSLKALRLVAYGLNFQIEFSIPGITDSGAWMAERFLRDRMSITGGWVVTKGQIAFTMNHPEGYQRNIEIEPRAERKSAFFAAINNHFAIPPDFQPGDGVAWNKALNDEFKKTTDYVVGLMTSN